MWMVLGKRVAIGVTLVSRLATPIEFLLRSKPYLHILRHLIQTDEIQACYEAIRWALIHNYNMVYVFLITLMQ